MKALVFSSYTGVDLLQQVDAEMATGFRPTLALVFQSAAHDRLSLGGSLHERGMDVVGSTTAGEIAREAVLEESCVVMALELAPGTFETCLYTDNEGQTTEEKARQLGLFAVDRFDDPIVFAFASGLKTDGEDIVRGVCAGAGREVPLFGGLAADGMKMEATYVFTGERDSDCGLVGLVLDGSRYDARGLRTSGWQAVGVEKTVSHSEGNVVHAIDGVPALEVYQHYFEMKGHQNGSSSIAMDLGVQYPLSIQRENGDAVIRAPLMSVDGTPSLVFAGGVPEGARVKFCIPPSLDITEQVVDEAREVRREAPDADAILLVSCAARLNALGPMIEDEVQGLYGLWRAPLIGFFSYGEIGPTASGACDFHNETCTLVVLREITS